MRGYFTIFVCVPIHNSFTRAHSDWVDIKTGMQELGADRIFFAAINKRRFLTSKYTEWVGHSFRGTALDWMVFSAKSAELGEDALHCIRERPPSLVHVNHVYTLGFAQRLLAKAVRSEHHVPVILDTHDVQSQLLKERGDINPWTHGHDSLDQLIRSEIAHLQKVDVLIHLSVDDFDFFKQRLPSKQHFLALPTIDESFISTVKAASPHSDPIDLLFVGQSTDPNCAAMKWFFEQVWPLIADRGYRIKIVGKVEMLVRKHLPEIYGTFRSNFVGPVAELAPYYQAARCVIAPMVSGTGVSIKTIEALALGKPFVGTSKAYRGMPMESIVRAGLEACDTPQRFADAIIYALAKEEAAAGASRTAFDKLFSKQAEFAARDEALDALLQLV